MHRAWNDMTYDHISIYDGACPTNENCPAAASQTGIFPGNGQEEQNQLDL